MKFIYIYIYIHIVSGAFILLSGVSEISCGVQNVPGEKGTFPSVSKVESGWRGLTFSKAESKRKRVQRLKNPQVLLPEESKQVQS